MDTFELDVIAVDKTFYTGPCRQIIVTAADGLIGIMAHHESSVIALVEGLLRIQTEDGNWIDAVAGIGHVQIAYNRVHVIVDFVENRTKSMSNVHRKLLTVPKRQCVRSRA